MMNGTARERMMNVEPSFAHCPPSLKLHVLRRLCLLRTAGVDRGSGIERKDHGPGTMDDGTRSTLSLPEADPCLPRADRRRQAEIGSSLRAAIDDRRTTRIGDRGSRIRRQTIDDGRWHPFRPIPPDGRKAVRGKSQEQKRRWETDSRGARKRHGEEHGSII